MRKAGATASKSPATGASPGARKPGAKILSAPRPASAAASPAKSSPGGKAVRAPSARPEEHARRMLGAHGGRKDHLAKKKVGLHDGLSKFATGERKIVRKRPDGVEDGALPEGHLSGDSEALHADGDDHDGQDGSDGEAGDSQEKSVLDVPEDWVDALKRQEEERKEQERIAKELADIAAQEERERVARAQAEAEEALFLQKAAEKKAEDERRRQERKEKREREAAERERKRVEAAEKVEAEIQAIISQAAADPEADERAVEQTKAVEARRARVAEIMAKVKTGSPAKPAADS